MSTPKRRIWLGVLQIFKSRPCAYYYSELQIATPARYISLSRKLAVLSLQEGRRQFEHAPEFAHALACGWKRKW